MNKKNIFIAVTIIVICTIANIVFVLTYLKNDSNRWVTYNDKKIGIRFDYPAGFKPFIGSGNDIELASETGADVRGKVTINRYFGFGRQNWALDVFKPFLIASSTVVILDFHGIETVLEFFQDSPQENTIYVQVDDAIFTLEIDNIDVDRFLKHLEFTKSQTLDDFVISYVGKDYKTLTNYRDKYQVVVPSYFGFVPRPYGVNFGYPYPGPGDRFSVRVSKTPLLTDPERYTFEKNIKIDGVDAVVMHSGNVNNGGEEFPEYKYVFFSRNGLYYMINTEYTDHEAVWKSFKFLKP